jgi:hypothetical protein
MNCIIYTKNNGKITYFVKNCKKEGRNFIGDNIKLYGVKERVFDFRWTRDSVDPVFDEEGKQIGWDKKVLEVIECPYYQGYPVSTGNDVDDVTKKIIREKYSLEDEIKILRKKMTGQDQDWEVYNSFIEQQILEGKQFKEKQKWHIDKLE